MKIDIKLPNTKYQTVLDQKDAYFELHDKYLIQNYEYSAKEYKDDEDESLGQVTKHHKSCSIIRKDFIVGVEYFYYQTIKKWRI